MKIDSSVIYNMTGCRSMKSKLQFLSAVFCNRDIQSPLLVGHDPNEDALASMELVLLKMKKGLKYGDSRFRTGGLWEGPSKEKLLSVISSLIVSFFSNFKTCFSFINFYLSLIAEKESQASYQLVMKGIWIYKAFFS